jgi:hypothetical protein
MRSYTSLTLWISLIVTAFLFVAGLQTNSQSKNLTNNLNTTLATAANVIK